MSLTIYREIFDRIKAVIADTGRINMLSWAEVRGSMMAESVDEIREMSPPGDCRTTFCIGGLICYLATSEQIARTAAIYDLSCDEVQEPSILSAALLLDGAEDKYELESAW